MWKIVVGFVVFAALSMYVIINAGDKADMGGEKHGEPLQTPEATAPAPAAAPASAPASAVQ